VLPEDTQLFKNDNVSSSKTKYHRTDKVQWRDACLSVSGTSTDKKNDVTLPTLDEAALLFGFATSH
jgi:hypothetical protein